MLVLMYDHVVECLEVSIDHTHFLHSQSSVLGKVLMELCFGGHKLNVVSSVEDID